MANKKQVYQVKGFMRGDESGQVYTNEWEGANAQAKAEKWLAEMGSSFELFKEGFAWVEA